MKRHKPWMIIVGALLIVALLPLFAVLSDTLGNAAALTLLAVFEIAGHILLIRGIVVNVAISRYNNELREKEKPVDELYHVICIHCNREFYTRNHCLRKHWKYPEGYVYCPYCREPNSKNVFIKISESDGIDSSELLENT